MARLPRSNQSRSPFPGGSSGWLFFAYCSFFAGAIGRINFTNAASTRHSKQEISLRIDPSTKPPPNRYRIPDRGRGFIGPRAIIRHNTGFMPDITVVGLAPRLWRYLA